MPRTVRLLTAEAVAAAGRLQLLPDGADNTAVVAAFTNAAGVQLPMVEWHGALVEAARLRPLAQLPAQDGTTSKGTAKYPLPATIVAPAPVGDEVLPAGGNRVHILGTATAPVKFLGKYNEKLRSLWCATSYGGVDRTKVSGKKYKKYLEFWSSFVNHPSCVDRTRMLNQVPGVWQDMVNMPAVVTPAIALYKYRLMHNADILALRAAMDRKRKLHGDAARARKVIKVCVRKALRSQDKPAREAFEADLTLSKTVRGLATVLAGGKSEMAHKKRRIVHRR